MYTFLYFCSFYLHCWQEVTMQTRSRLTIGLYLLNEASVTSNPNPNPNPNPNLNPAFWWSSGNSCYLVELNSAHLQWPVSESGWTRLDPRSNPPRVCGSPLCWFCHFIGPRPGEWTPLFMCPRAKGICVYICTRAAQLLQATDLDLAVCYGQIRRRLWIPWE